MLNLNKSIYNITIEYLKTFFVSISYLLFTKNPLLGLFIFVLILTNPVSCTLAIIAFASLIVAGKLFGMLREQMVSGLFTYNSILIGLLMGYIYDISFTSIIFTIAASFFTFLLSYAMFSFLNYFSKLPILNLPFAISAILVYLSSGRYSNLLSANHSYLSVLNIDSLPFWISGLLKSLGIIIFMPYDLIGLCIIILMLIFSRIYFFLIIVGYYTGTLFLFLFKGSFQQAFSDPYSFNFILISLALGGLFLIPSLKTYIIAITGVLISVFILDAGSVFWSSYNIPVFTFPFVAVVSLILLVTQLNKFPFVTIVFLSSPEENLEHYINYSARFRSNIPQPHLPFTGEWKVYQGFNDEWTHKGIWENAVDFVIEDKSDKKNFENNGAILEDYYSFNKPVFSPITGTVIDAGDDLPDNQIGYIDRENKWGNYIIILSSSGFYVEISHLANKSIIVKQGDHIRAGQLIGRCGNSGHSPEPHIHMQCQNLPYIGAPAVPFFFSNCIINNKYFFNENSLSKGQKIYPMPYNRELDLKLQFILDDKFIYDFFKNDKKTGSVEFQICMNQDGAFYFFDKKNYALLFFSRIDNIFSFYRFEGNYNSPLKYFFIALPRLPISEEQIKWDDQINPILFNKKYSIFIKSFNHRLFNAFGCYELTKDNRVTGEILFKTFYEKVKIQTNLIFSKSKGFEELEMVDKNNVFKLIRST